MVPHERAQNRLQIWDGLLAALALAVILTLFLAAPGSLLDKADRAAYAVCHRIAERSFIVDGRPLPLCARCSGTYLGALAGFSVLALRGRGRAAQLPAARYLTVLAGFVLPWALDGLNSYLTLLPGLPHLYEPHNLLRLATGTLEGLAIAALLLPVINMALWRAPLQAAPVTSWRDLAWLLAGGALIVAVVDSEWAPLLLPLALLSGLMILGLLGILNTVVVLMLSRREAQATAWRALVLPGLTGLALAMSELAAIGIARAYVTVRFGLPF